MVEGKNPYKFRCAPRTDCLFRNSSAQVERKRGEERERDRVLKLLHAVVDLIGCAVHDGGMELPKKLEIASSEIRVDEQSVRRWL